MMKFFEEMVRARMMEMQQERLAVPAHSAKHR